jgi:hypothetical protein
LEVVKKSTDAELAKCVRNFESVCDGMNESMNAYKSQTDATVDSLRLETNQNKEEAKNKVEELTLEIRSVTSSLDKCKSNIQTKTKLPIGNSEIKFRN